MKKVNEIVYQPAPQQARPELTAAQRDSVGFFFARLRLMYPAQYTSIMYDEKTETLTKREYARRVCDLSTDQIDRGFNRLHQVRENDPNEWRYLDLSKVIGFIRNSGDTWQHRVLEAKNAEPVKALPSKRTDEQKAEFSELVNELRDSLMPHRRPRLSKKFQAADEAAKQQSNSVPATESSPQTEKGKSHV